VKKKKNHDFVNSYICQLFRALYFCSAVFFIMTLKQPHIYYIIEISTAGWLLGDTVKEGTSRSKWQSGLRHVLSSVARTLGSWIRIPLEARMCVRVFLCCVVL
jgi:hypothetical protein